MSRDSKMRKFLEDMADSMEEAGLDSEELVTEVRRRMPKGLLKQVMIDHLEEEHSELWRNFLRSNFEISR